MVAIVPQQHMMMKLTEEKANGYPHQNKTRYQCKLGKQ